MELISQNKSFGGLQLRYEHASTELNCNMRFSVYLPPGASADKPVPAIYWLSGLTCTDENFVHKAGAQQHAADWGVALIVPDTSPRGDQVPGDGRPHRRRHLMHGLVEGEAGREHLAAKQRGDGGHSRRIDERADGGVGAAQDIQRPDRRHLQGRVEGQAQSDHHENELAEHDELPAVDRVRHRRLKP